VQYVIGMVLNTILEFESPVDDLHQLQFPLVLDGLCFTENHIQTTLHECSAMNEEELLSDDFSL